MFSNPKGIALLLSVSISTIVTASLFLIPDIAAETFLSYFFTSFAVTFVLSSILLEVLIFREIKKLYKMLNKLRKHDYNELRAADPNNFQPLNRINKEIYTYALVKQREIDDLKKVEAFRKDFIANISHEIKTPLFAAQGFVHTLLDGAVKDKSVRNKFLKKAAKSLDALDALVQDILTLSHIETGEIKMHFENFDIVPLIRDVMEQLEDKAEKKNIKLNIAHKSPKSLIVYADWQRISQVFLNLVSNAIKYNKEEGNVSIGFSEREEFVEVYVKDDGDGIPKKDINRIFERFYRVDKSRSRERGGTGLGLAIVKHIMEGHNSVVEVKSKVGKGSKFTFQLPRENKDVIAEEEENEN